MPCQMGVYQKNHDTEVINDSNPIRITYAHNLNNDICNTIEKAIVIVVASEIWKLGVTVVYSMSLDLYRRYRELE
jgi:hypothetical protein